MSCRVTWLVLLMACGSATGLDGGVVDRDSGVRVDDAGLVDAGSPDAAVDAGSPDAGVSDAGPADAGFDAGAVTDAGARDAGFSYVRGSLGGCWRDARCQRVFSIAHGGSWNASIPYDSNGAIAASFADGSDGVKVDVRVTMDNVPVISHSSPLQFYESLDCLNRRIEDMTVAQVTACHRLPSTTETFQRLDEVLTYVRGKMVVQLTVKRAADLARTIAEVHAQHAEDYAFLEISATELTTVIPTIPGGDTISYVINAEGNVAVADTVIGSGNPRAFLVEFDPPTTVADVVSTKLHPAGLRSFTYTNASTPSVTDLKALFDKGYDVVSSQSGPNGVAARKQVNQQRGVSPP